MARRAGREVYAHPCRLCGKEHPLLLYRAVHSVAESYIALFCPRLNSNAHAGRMGGINFLEILLTYNIFGHATDP